MIAIGAARAARAADDPLLVVVETQPGLGVDAADIRRRIASELGTQVVSPSDPAALHASQVLIVALDERDIRISMRSGASARVSRTIPDVAERAARLRAVTWLAGNLARDQVGRLLPSLAPAPTPESATTPTAPAAPVAQPPAIAVPAVRPQPASTTAAAIAVEVDDGNASVGPRWAITASGGATFTDTCLHVGSPTMFTCTARYSSFAYGSTYQLEVLHKTRDEGMMIGAALDTGPDPHLVGLAGLIGTRRPWAHWYLEGILGAGIEAERTNVATTTVLSSSTSGTSSDLTVTQQVQPALYVRATGSIGMPINRTFDFLASLSAHLSSSGLYTDFIGASAGLRLKLP